MPAFFKKAMPYILINIICPILLLIWYFSNDVSFIILSLLVYAGIAEAVYAMVTLHDISSFITGLITVLAVVLVNIFAFRSVKKDKVKAGIILSLFGGTVCSFIAVKTVNRDYRAKTAVYVIFNIFIWILAWLVSPWIIVAFS